MSYIFQPPTESDPADTKPARKGKGAEDWRQLDFGMDCLVPAKQQDKTPDPASDKTAD